MPREDVDAYVKSRILPAGGPSQAARVDGSGANLLLKECPSAGFCSPTKYAGTGKPGNDYKFAILRDGGAYFCHRCGGKGSWYDLRLGMSGAVPSSLEGEVQSTPRVRSGDTPRPDAAIAARCPVALFDAQGSEVKRYLNETRGLNDTTLAVYGVGYASRKFRDGERWVDEPCATFPWIQVPDDGPASTVRLKVRSVRTKRHMRVEPAGLLRCPSLCRGVFLYAVAATPPLRETSRQRPRRRRGAGNFFTPSPRDFTSATTPSPPRHRREAKRRLRRRRRLGPLRPARRAGRRVRARHHRGRVRRDGRLPGDGPRGRVAAERRRVAAARCVAVTREVQAHLFVVRRRRGAGAASVSCLPVVRWRGGGWDDEVRRDHRHAITATRPYLRPRRPRADC